jgi:TRAP-type C4-dicarboxylate transport system substrate-binding protein
MTREVRKGILAAGIAFLLFLPRAAGPQETREGVRPGDAPRVFRMATLAPDGTQWADAAREAARRIRAETGGRVTLKWYMGAVMGDEAGMLERMRRGELDGGVFSMAGLTRVAPSLALLSLPFLFEDEQEAEEISRQFFPVFRKRFHQEQTALLGLFSLGFGRLFTTKPAESLEEIAELRTWTWKGDPLGEKVLRAMGFRHLVPLSITDVLPALQFQLLDAFSGTCYSIAVLQWFPYARYAVSLNWAYTFGGIVLQQAAFSELSSQDRDVFRRVFSTLLQEMEDGSLKNEKEARRVLSSVEGMREIRLSREDETLLRQRSEGLYGQLARELREEGLLESILAARAALRKPPRAEPARPPAQPSE